MERRELSALAHADHPIAAPLSDDSVAHLLRRAIRGPADHLLDLGCGEGAWQLRALRADDGVTAVGVDVAGTGFDDVRAEATRLGIADRLDLRRQDVAEYESTRKADLVLSVGAAYAFGGLRQTLAAARRHLTEDGILLLGDCFWEHEPEAAIRAVLEDGPQKYTDLAGTVAEVVADGWTPVYGYVSTIAEWDEYEWCWTGSLARWALDHQEHPDSEQAARLAADHRAEWLGGYRGVLGFVVLLLCRTPTPAS